MRLISIDEAIDCYNKDKIYVYNPPWGLYIVRRNCWREGHHCLVSYEGAGQKGTDVYNDKSDGALEVLQILREAHRDSPKYTSGSYLKVYELDNKEEIEQIKERLDLIKKLDK